MLKTQILAAEVSNLTDARYFAAWGVDFLSFNCNIGANNYVPQEQVVEIKEWIEGPKIFAQFNGDFDVSIMETLVDELNLDGIVLEETAAESVAKSVDAEILLKFYNDAVSSIESVKSIVKTKAEDVHKYFEKNVLLDVEDLSIDIIKAILNQSKCGLVLRGGEEEKVGLKTFDF